MKYCPVIKKSRKYFLKCISTKQKMKYCKKCHKRVLTTEKFVGPRNYIWECGKFCQCNTHVVGGYDGPRAIAQYRKGRLIAGEVKNDD